MNELNLILRSEINPNDTDILENISITCEAILFEEETNCWIEIMNKDSINVFFVPNGWEGTKTNSIIEAYTALIKYKIDNNIN